MVIFRFLSFICALSVLFVVALLWLHCPSAALSAVFVVGVGWGPFSCQEQVKPRNAHVNRNQHMCECTFISHAWLCCCCPGFVCVSFLR